MLLSSINERYITTYLSDENLSKKTEVFFVFLFFIFIMNSHGYLSNTRYKCIRCTYEFQMEYIGQLFTGQMFELYTA